MNRLTMMNRAGVTAVCAIACTLCGCDRGATTEATDAGTGDAPAKSTSYAQSISTGRSSAASNPAGWPAVEFEPPLLDFGVIEPGDTGQGTAKIWNVGTTPLRIIKSITSCGCTQADDLGGRVIQPGQHTEFSTTMEMKSGLGQKREKVTLFFAGYEQTMVPYYFQAEVSLPVRVEPPHITAIQTMRGELSVSSRDGKPFSILAVHGDLPDLVGFDPAADPPRNAYTVRYDLTERDRAGTVPWFYVIETDHPEAPLVDVRVRHNSTRAGRVSGRPWVPKDQRVVIGVAAPGQPVEVKAKLEYQPNQVPAPSTASVSCDPTGSFDVRLIEAVVDGQFLKFKIEITPKPGPPGLIYGDLAMHASGFSYTARVIGRRTGD